ncbi:MAG: arylamine N-acetyltransferase [Stenomitos rutilans HA7619-LM2]|jgi:N-hydroxyarylamine O-acetyltransferase|nr:arylamine N-acetyltransferase [Stenomitos rutilans HA7619-LM2]
MKNQFSDSINLDAYFERIGYSGDRTPTLQTLQAICKHHTETIAFENLNPLLKQPVLLDIQSIQQKLIHKGRGGYCFEQNSLLRAVLIALGFQITNLAARVLWNLPEGTITPLSHMVLRVDLNNELYIVDVGFGGATPTTPLLLKPDLEQPTPHEPFRLLKTDDAYTLQILIGQAWKSVYCFDLHVRQLPDYEVSNWYVSTHPASHFVTSLMVTRPDPDKRNVLLNNQLTAHYLDGRTERHRLDTVEALRAALTDVFHLQLPAIAGMDETFQRLIEPDA